MNTPFSIVIVCRNEAAAIGQTLEGLVGLSDDILVYDTGSEDGTQDIIRSFPVRLVEGDWLGFGPTKNAANALAQHDWILSLDADEVPDERLRVELASFSPSSPLTVFICSFLNFIGERPLRFGEWGWDKHVRLFHRRQAAWDEAEVHEKLLYPAEAVRKQLAGKILHRTVKNWNEHRSKMDRYASMNARKYREQGKRSRWWKRLLSPTFTFFHYYFLRLGFLDGRAGFQCAWMTALYTHWKYERLRKLYRG